MVATKEDVRRTLVENEARLRGMGVAKIGLFGSFVRGDQRPDSDIDLLVEFAPGKKTFDSFMGLSFLRDATLKGLIGKSQQFSFSTGYHLRPFARAFGTIATIGLYKCDENDRR